MLSETVARYAHEIKEELRILRLFGGGRRAIGLSVQRITMLLEQIEMACVDAEEPGLGELLGLDYDDA